MPSVRLRPTFGALTLAAALAPAAAHAQLAALELRAGMAPVVGQYRHELDPGPTLGVALTAAVGPALGVRADASWATLRLLSAGEIHTYTLGVEAQLVPARGRRRGALQLGATLGGGASQLRFAREKSWHPAVVGGVRLTADLTRRFGLFADASAAATLLGRRERVLDAATDAGGTLVRVPLTAGVRLRL